MELLCFSSGMDIPFSRRVIFQHVPEKPATKPKQQIEHQKTPPEKAAGNAINKAQSDLERFRQDEVLKAGLAKMYNLATFEALVTEHPKKRNESPKIMLEISQANDVERLQQIIEKNPAVELALKDVFSDPEKYKPKNSDDIRSVFKTSLLLERDENGDNILATGPRDLVAGLSIHERLYVFLKAPEIVGRTNSYNNEDNGWIELKKAVLESFGFKQRHDTFH